MRKEKRKSLYCSPRPKRRGSAYLREVKSLVDPFQREETGNSYIDDLLWKKEHKQEREAILLEKKKRGGESPKKKRWYFLKKGGRKI